MAKEKWNYWKRDVFENDNYYIDKLIDDNIKASIYLVNDNLSVEVLFDGLIEVIKKSDEKAKLLSILEIQSEYGADFFTKCPIYKVENSKLIAETIKNSNGIYQNIKLYHFVILDYDYFIDVISQFEPKIIIRTIEKQTIISH